MNDTKGRSLELILEATRRCNFTCDHCLRGDARNIDMSKTMYDRVIENFGILSKGVTVTGGEPLLHKELWSWLEESFKAGRLVANTIWACTNGSIDPMHALRKLSNIYDIGVECSMQVSVDGYHDEEPNRFYQSHIVGFNIMHNEDIAVEGKSSSEKPLGNTICMGRAADIVEHDTQTYLQVYNPFSEEAIELYVSCEGKIYPACDLSYDVMDLEGLVLWDLVKNPVADLDKMEAKCSEIFGGSGKILIYPDGDYLEV